MFKTQSERTKTLCPLLNVEVGAVMGVEITASAGGGGRSSPTGEGGSEEVVWEPLCRLSRGRHYLQLSVIAR